MPIISSAQTKQIITPDTTRANHWQNGECYIHNLCKMRGYMNRCSGCCDLKPEGTDTSFRNDSGPALRAAKSDYSKVYAKGTAHPPKPTKPVHSRGVSLGALQKNFFDVYVFLFCFSVKVNKGVIGWQLVPTRGDTILREEAARAPSTIGVSGLACTFWGWYY